MTDHIKIEGKNGIYAKVLRHSKSAVSGDELLTIEGNFPRIILPELQTHRMLFLRDMISKNLQSSRAVPLSKMLREVKDNPFVPTHFGKNKPGMSAETEVEDTKLAKDLWLDAAYDAYCNAVAMEQMGLHKQIVNRAIEPFVMSKAVISATDWNNLFHLRDHDDAQPECRDLVRCIIKAKEISNPMLIEPGEWHVPYVHTDRNAFGEFIYYSDSFKKISAETAKKISSSCNAQVSYRLLNTSEEKAEDIHSRLIGSVPGHWCYDKETEILTDRGWVLFDNLNDKDKVAAVNIKDRTCEFEIPKQIHKSFYSGNLLHLYGQQIDSMVTPNHNHVVQKRTKAGWTEEYGLERAEDITGSSRKYLTAVDLKTDVRSNYLNYSPDFIGFFIGDGYLERLNSHVTKKRVSFRLKRERKISYLKNILDRDGVNYSFKCDNSGVSVFRIQDDALYDYLMENAYSEDIKSRFKRIPKELMFSSKENTFSLLDGLKNSDGSIKRKTWTYSSTSKILVDQIQAICAVNNINTTVSKKKKESEKHSDSFNINISTRITPEVSPNRRGRADSRSYSEVKYNDFVYCVTTSTGAVITRRNNIVLISGNSPLEHVATPMGRFEWFKRQLAAKFIGDDICLYRGNFRGFNSYRKTFKMENMNMDYVPANE